LGPPTRIRRASRAISDARRALLEGLWDYAGVFPPAELPLDEAVAEWRRIQSSDDAWLVNRFVARAGTDVDVEPVAVVDGREERQGDVVYVEGETKLRCGGAHVPTRKEIGVFIRRCRDEGTRFKATAGLHHALPTDGEHGFLNLLAACVFGDEEAMLATREISLDAESFHAGGHSADAETCARVRRELFASIGSCSFAEPVGELRALGIL
jgi:hypothetical protein